MLFRPLSRRLSLGRALGAPLVPRRLVTDASREARKSKISKKEVFEAFVVRATFARLLNPPAARCARPADPLGSRPCSILLWDRAPASASRAAQAFDKDKDGFITRDDFRRAISKSDLSVDEVKELITEADIDGDGKINYQEFVTLMNTHPEVMKGEMPADKKKPYDRGYG
jgi:hypothetical protein